MPKILQDKIRIRIPTFTCADEKLSGRVVRAEGCELVDVGDAIVGQRTRSLIIQPHVDAIHEGLYSKRMVVNSESRAVADC